MSKDGAGRVLVVGGGPVGLTAAIYVAQKGYDVDVFEKREDPREQQNGAQPPKTIFYGLSGRGKSALIAADVRIPQQLGERLGGLTKGGSMYGISRKKSWWGTETTRTQGNMLPDWTFVDRSALVQHLTTETQRLHPDRIRLHFQHSVKGVDWQKRQAVFEDASGSPRTCAYDLLVASDGRHSKCRRLYQAHDPSFTSFLRPSPKDYAGFSGLTLPDDVAAQHTLRDENGLHLKIWRGMSDQWSIMLSSNTQDTVTGYISANRAAIAPICTHEDYTLILDQQFPHMQASLRRLIADAVVGSTKQDMGASGCVSSLVGPRFVMMGDAAHSVKPDLGQGANSGIQDCHIFGQVLTDCGHDLDSALQRFEETRHPETLALHQLDLIVGTWIGIKGQLHPLSLAFKFHSIVQLCLAKLRGGGFKQTPFYELMAGGLPYTKAKAKWEHDRNVFFSGAALLCAAAVSWAIKSLSI